MPVPSQESEWPCTLCLSIFASFYDFDIWFWNCSDNVVFFVFHFISKRHVFLSTCIYRGGSRRGGRTRRAPPPPPPKIGKNMIFWRKIIFFHWHEIPQKCSRLPPQGAIFLSAPPPPLTWNPGSAPDIYNSDFPIRFDLIWFDFWCFNATFSKISAISWQPVLVVEEAGVPGENHRPRGSNW